MESGGQYENGRYKPDYHKGTQSMWNMMPQHQIKEQHNALVMNKKIMSILVERDAAIKERNEAITAKTDALSARDKALQERDKALEERDNAIMERESALNALQFRESNLNYILSRSSNQQNLPDPSPISIIPPTKRKKKDLNREVASPGKKCKKEWDINEIGLVVKFDETKMQAPVCTCTGTARQCYKWGNGGWQSSCCTTTLSQYPLPQLPNKRHSRIGGRKMSGSVFGRLLSRLASEGHELSSSPVDLKDYWARHGTNRYITIK